MKKYGLDALLPALQAWRTNNPGADAPTHVVMAMADYFLASAELDGSKQIRGGGNLLTVYGAAIMIDPALEPGRFNFYTDKKLNKRPMVQ